MDTEILGNSLKVQKKPISESGFPSHTQMSGWASICSSQKAVVGP